MVTVTGKGPHPIFIYVHIEYISESSSQVRVFWAPKNFKKHRPGRPEIWRFQTESVYVKMGPKVSFYMRSLPQKKSIRFPTKIAPKNQLEVGARNTERPFIFGKKHNPSETHLFPAISFKGVEIELHL